MSIDNQFITRMVKSRGLSSRGFLEVVEAEVADVVFTADILDISPVLTEKIEEGFLILGRSRNARPRK